MTVSFKQHVQRYLNSRRVRVLLYLKDRRVNMTQISEETGVDYTSVMEYVQQMEKEQLVETEMDAPKKGRYVKLTKRGEGWADTHARLSKEMRTYGVE